ncbi:DUF4178 domain-containing protein [Hasllibacter sp. MH4015]|uniref:DUF4178 domain-containing protein n=1 Tax=Hasllibacter sp. MH4015 TaxID=2854029 RepID=UPI001CD2443B|nr:DUF4178 domain-containing protein [Hasllibacter sp. MH4015]
MTASHGLSSINCTSCGAGLSVLGGGRVLSHVCGYCGAVLDTQDNYKVLDSIGKRNHPASPVQIGQTLNVDGVDFTVIGTLGIVERYGGRVWKWVEHQIFSPTHGYLWLNVEDGNLTFTRKVRDFNMQHWLSSSTVERSETPPRRSYKGETYKYYDSAVTEIDFMEGEFNWVPKLGEKKEVVNLLGPDGMLGLVKSQTEREVELTRLLPRAETARDLGFDESALGTASPHPLAPYLAWPEEGFLRRALAVTALVALVLGLAFMFNSGRNILTTQAVDVASLPASFEFDVTNTAQLARLEFRTNFNNQWASFAAEVLGPDGEPVVAGARAISYYSGRSGGESWSEGSRSGNFRFRPGTEGTHRVRLELMESSATPPTGTVQLRVAQGKPTAFWLFVLAGLSAIGYVIVRGRKSVHESRRFAGSDWSD